MPTLPREELIRAIEASYIDHISSLGNIGIPGSCLRIEPDMIIYSSGLPISTFNGIMRPRLSSGALPKRVESAMSYFKRARIPMCWVLGPSSEPPELEEFLLSNGLALELVYSGMAIDPNTLDSKPLPSGLEIQPVRDMASLRGFIEVSAEAFEIPEETRAGWGQLISKLWGQPNIFGFLGNLNGEPVSTSVLVLHESVASIYMVATLKEARGKGIGSAMTREPLIYAQEAGRDIAVLEASEMGFPVYERMGFRKVCEFRFLTWTP
jgi:ribosomal protein S18 acetylase RimI-like enzyme